MEKLPISSVYWGIILGALMTVSVQGEAQQTGSSGNAKAEADGGPAPQAPAAPEKSPSKDKQAQAQSGEPTEPELMADGGPAEAPLQLKPLPSEEKGGAGKPAPLIEPPPGLQLETGAKDGLVPPWNKKKEGNVEEGSTEEWEDRGLQVFEIHGYFRTRGDLFHKFSLRGDDALFPRPLEENSQYTTDCRKSAWGEQVKCDNWTQAGANMKLRLEPQINVSEEVRVKAQFDFLDNLVLGSTPSNQSNGGQSLQNGTVNPARFTSSNQDPPSVEDMIKVRRAWAEVMTPLGELRFGRMGDEWGLGILHNAGGDIYQDYGDSIDRVLFATKIAGIILIPAFDFINEGPTSATISPKPWNTAAQPFDVAQVDDAYQITGIVAYKQDKDEQDAMLRRGDVVMNTGIYFQYRSQVLSFEPIDSNNDGTLDTQDMGNNTTQDVHNFIRRDYWGVVPDFWWQLLWEHLHVELEFAFIYGDVKNVEVDNNPENGRTNQEIIEYGGALHVDYGLLNDQLRLGLRTGYASGDNGVEGMRAPTDMSQPNDTKDHTFSLMSFNPAYQIDLILFREILGSINGAYYFDPWVRYDFIYSRTGKQLGAQLDILYSRASETQSTIGNSGNLGVEIDVGLFYRSEDMFFAGIQYGVLFPLAAFEGTVQVRDPQNPTQLIDSTDTDLFTAQTVRGMLGVSF